MNWKVTNTEVLIELINNYGLESSKITRWYVSFGLYDKKNNKVYLVRDRFGEKLYTMGILIKLFSHQT